MPLVISWTGLRRYEECGQLHKLTISRKTKEKPADNRLFIPGTTADRVMRRWLNQDDPQPGQMTAWLPEMYEELCRQYGPIKWRSQIDKGVTRNQIRDGLVALEPLLERYVLPYAWHPEWHFEAAIRIPYLDGSLTSILLVGGVDILVCRDLVNFDTAWYHYDLKLTANADYWRKTLGQLTFYDIAIRTINGETSGHGFLQPLVTKEPFKEITISEDDRREMMRRIIRMAHGMWKKDFAPKADDVGCKNCAGYSACEKFKLNITQMLGRKHVSLRRGPTSP